jgi:glucokinase
MSPNSPTPVVLAYDLGGTKVSVGVVDAEGRVLEERREPVRAREGQDALLRQLSDLGREFLSRNPGVRRAGVASAGPLDPVAGTLLNPTNLSAHSGGDWGVVPLAPRLSESLGIPVRLENDAAAAMLAEHWIGAARGYANAMILTLGTGLGTGVVANGELVRAGRQLHPEGGHIILRYDDETAPCNCGNLGCAEAYLSGMHFTNRARRRLGDESLTTVAIAALARNGDPRARAAFDEYAEAMSAAIASYVALYCPEIIVFTGSFANAADLFLDTTRARLERRLARRRTGVDLMPRLALSSLSNHAGLIGGAYVALRD